MTCALRLVIHFLVAPPVLTLAAGAASVSEACPERAAPSALRTAPLHFIGSLADFVARRQAALPSATMKLWPARATPFAVVPVMGDARMKFFRRKK